MHWMIWDRTDRPHNTHTIMQIMERKRKDDHRWPRRYMRHHHHHHTLYLWISFLSKVPELGYINSFNQHQLTQNHRRKYTFKHHVLHSHTHARHGIVDLVNSTIVEYIKTTRICVCIVFLFHTLIIKMQIVFILHSWNAFVGSMFYEASI